ncbi:hypothetical protein BGZ67_005502 [Mortierella alpina]|nr:hypothetical protein BGZ67_005502 [Mortierella alpina]
MTMSHILTTRKSRRFLLIFLILSVGCILMIMLNHSQGSLSFESYSGYFGLDSNWKPITAENSRWRGQTVAKPIELPEATWTCTDDDLAEQDKETKLNRRSRQCVVENLCVDRKGAFIRSNGLWSRKNMPKVNLMSSDEESDDFWQPRLERSWRKVIHAHFVNETVFVHGLYSPFHFSHWLYNGMIPLYSTMKRFGGTKNSWTFRGGRFKYDPIDRQGAWEMDHFFETGKELVLSQAEMSTPFQSLPPADAPICFRRAVIGLGSQCALSYCENNIPAEIYKGFREEISEYYWSSPETWERHLVNAREAINKGLSHQEHGHKRRQDEEAKEQEQEQKMAKKRQDTAGNKLANSQLRCLELARYYNFEAAGPNHGLEQGEAKSRIGQMNPDVEDSENGYQNLFVEVDDATNETKGEAVKESKRKLVVGIIQREKSRRLINDEELIQGLVQAGFRVKWMSFDHGCGLAETAYLLRDVNVLISPHGNAIGTSIFMPNHEPVSTVVSVDNSRYWEGWFRFTATAIGQRFIQTVCGPSSYVDESLREQCPFYKDLAGGLDLIGGMNLVLGLPDSMVKSDEEKKSMSGHALSALRDTYRSYVKNNPAAQKLAEQEMEVLIGAEQPNELIHKYGEDTWTFLANFWKGAPRYVDVGRVVKFVQSLQRDVEHEKIVESSVQQNHSMDVAQRPYELYVEYVRKGQACGFEGCEEILQRNVADEKTTAYGKHSIDDVSKWGQPTNQSQALRNGLTPEVLKKSWQIDV